jgi:hypothetical protein
VLAENVEQEGRFASCSVKAIFSELPCREQINTNRAENCRQKAQGKGEVVKFLILTLRYIINQICS